MDLKYVTHLHEHHRELLKHLFIITLPNHQLINYER